MLRVGLTGGIASGKSTVARMLGEAGCFTVDADRLVAALYRPGAAGQRALVAAYGPGVIDASGEVDRQRVADIAFSSAEQAQALNELIHPLVIEETERILAAHEAAAAAESIAVVEASLLIESGGLDRYDRIVVVDVDPGTQIARGIARGLTHDEVTRRIAHQLPRAERLQYADYVIDNSGSLEDLTRQTHTLLAALRREAAEKTPA